MDRNGPIEVNAKYLIFQRSFCIAVSATLGFFFGGTGPLVRNKAVAGVQERLQARVMEIDLEVHQDEFSYWRKFDRKRKAK